MGVCHGAATGTDCGQRFLLNYGYTWRTRMKRGKIASREKFWRTAYFWPIRKPVLQHFLCLLFRRSDC